MNITTAWLFSTFVLAAGVVVVDKVIGGGIPEHGREVIFALIVVVINTAIWLPMLRRSYKKTGLSIASSVVSSIVAGYAGVAMVIGLVGLYAYVVSLEMSKAIHASGGPEPDVSMSLTGPFWGFLLPGVLWGLNGLLF